MKIETMIKMAVGFIGGIIFWLFWFLITMVYSFMPITKLSHERIFNMVAPFIYLIIAGSLMNKFFQEKGWKNYLINILIIILMAVVALFIADVLMKLVS